MFSLRLNYIYKLETIKQIKCANHKQPSVFETANKPPFFSLNLFDLDGIFIKIFLWDGVADLMPSPLRLPRLETDSISSRAIGRVHLDLFKLHHLSLKTNI